VRKLVEVGTRHPMPAGSQLYDFLVGGVERELIEQVMLQCDGVKVTAADRLGINRNTLHKKLAQYRIDGDDTAAGAGGGNGHGNGNGDGHGDPELPGDEE
jgi:DNA-binding NtrC family response regulator